MLHPRKPRRKQCEGCGLIFMDNELKIIHAKVRVGKKKIIRPHLALCHFCREIEILEGI